MDHQSFDTIIWSDSDQLASNELLPTYSRLPTADRNWVECSFTDTENLKDSGSAKRGPGIFVEPFLSVSHPHHTQNLVESTRNLSSHSLKFSRF